jgi:CubicO group peptidase (beta-lactamase class C family)
MRIGWSGLSVCFLLLFPAAGTRAAEPLAGLDEHIQQTLRDWEVPGLGLAIIKDDKVVRARGYGVRQLGESHPVTANTRFAIASCSKAFTATALALLVDEGKLSWDDPVRKHLRDLELHDTFASRELTIRDLLCHRGGLPRYDMIWYGSGEDRSSVLRRLRHARLGTSFRSQFGYQNILFLAAGEVVPAVTGKSWDDFVSQRLFAPLGMKSSSTTTRAFTRKDPVASPHLRIDGTVQVIPWRNIDNAGPAGSINSTVSDMARWVRFQLNGGVWDGKRLITTRSLQETHTPQAVIRTDGMGPEGITWRLTHPGSRLLNYGLGWVVREYRGRVVVQHGGSIDGMRSLVVLVPEERLGFVLLSNRGRTYLPEALSQHLLDAYLGGPPRDWSGELLAVTRSLEREANEAEQQTEKERIKDTQPSLALPRYAGLYRDPLYGEIRIVWEKDRLVVRYGKLEGTLEHWHHDTFRSTWNDRTFRKSLVTFRLDRRGEPDEVRLPLGDEIVAPRAPRAATEPALALKPEQLSTFVGTFRRTAPPLEVTVELLDDKLKYSTFGTGPATLMPIAPNRLRVEGSGPAVYLTYHIEKGEVRQVTLERDRQPAVVLLPGK